MIYILTNRNDSDRTDFVIDQFTSRDAAETYQAELGYGTVEEWDSIEDARGE